MIVGLSIGHAIGYVNGKSDGQILATGSQNITATNEGVKANSQRGSKLKRVNLLILLLMLSCVPVAGCANKPVIIDTGCKWTRRMLAHPLDTVETKRQILAHDKMRFVKCRN